MQSEELSKFQPHGGLSDQCTSISRRQQSRGTPAGFIVHLPCLGEEDSALRHLGDFHCQCCSEWMWPLLPVSLLVLRLTSDVDLGHVDYLKSFHPRPRCPQSVGWKLGC